MPTPPAMTARRRFRPRVTLGTLMAVVALVAVNTAMLRYVFTRQDSRRLIVLGLLLAVNWLIIAGLRWWTRRRTPQGASPFLRVFVITGSLAVAAMFGIFLPSEGSASMAIFWLMAPLYYVLFSLAYWNPGPVAGLLMGIALFVLATAYLNLAISGPVLGLAWFIASAVAPDDAPR